MTTSTPSRYVATIGGNDISRAPEYDVGDDLEQAKTQADNLLGDGFLNHTIFIYDRTHPDEAVACRAIKCDDWWTP